MNITSFGKALQVKGSTIYRWYRDVLSDYAQDKTMMHKHDIIKGGKVRAVIEVSILKAENFGAKMAIDEKHIGQDICTVISNRETGKIAMLAKSLNYSDIKDIFQHNNSLLGNIKSITRDFSGLFEKVCTELMPQATQIGDKFHIIRNMMDAHQSVRIRYRQKELEKRRRAFQEFKLSEQNRLNGCKRTGQKFKSNKFHYKGQRMNNAETMLEILARSRYLLYKFPGQWNTRQKRRAEILFDAFPQINLTYHLCNQFRVLMSNLNIGKGYLQIDKELHQWYDDVENADVDEMLSFKSMVESNEDIIRNYFISGESNAIAEAINSKIQKLITSNNGNRDRDFFFFRIAQFYA
jgi:transposase